MTKSVYLESVIQLSLLLVLALVISHRRRSQSDKFTFRSALKLSSFDSNRHRLWATSQYLAFLSQPPVNFLVACFVQSTALVKNNLGE